MSGRLVRGAERLASIGSALCNVTCHVADLRYESLCAIGVWGELWLSGVQVARGYLSRPEKTAEAFAASPWINTNPSERAVAYRTGDRVRWYADGELEFGGRIDFQVKLRGQRLELGEIEHAMSAQPGVIEAVVLLVQDLEALVAYISPASAVVGPQADDLPKESSVVFERATSLHGVRDVLPAYMVPSLVVGVDEWPRTSSGKIDRKRLPPPDARANARELVAPRSAQEATVRECFAAVLRIAVEAISVEASFFELGGNSLRAVALSLIHI